MEDKKLNIVFAENAAVSSSDDPCMNHFDTQYGSFNNLEINDDKETLMDAIKWKDWKINELKDQILELEMKMKEKEIDILKLTSESSKQSIEYNTINLQMEYGGSKITMNVPQLKPFQPVIENKIAGPGSIVIQRRLDGSFDFERSLHDYHEGFGTRKGDFWLGLEKIHKITSHQRHELYIHIVDYEGKTHYAKYDNFVVGRREEEYVLKSLGHYSGNANDMMRLNEGQEFSVGWKYYKTGWWWMPKVKPTCNLNGKFSETMVDNYQYIFWGLKKWGNKKNVVKSVQMLIRPYKEETKS